MCVHYRFFRRCDVRHVRIIGRVINEHSFAVGQIYLVDNRRSSCDKVEIIFSLQTLLDYLHVQKSEEATSETKAQRNGSFRLKGQ